MPIPIQHMEERLSIAYVSAVAAKAGAALFVTGGTEYGVDGFLQRVTLVPEIGYVQTGHAVSCQIKSTINGRWTDTNVAYDMAVAAYNKINIQSRTGPFILLLFCLPEEVEDWLHVDEDRFLLKKCCYWQHFQGTFSTNGYQQVIHIPRTKIFTPASVLEILDKVDRGEI